MRSKAHRRSHRHFFRDLQESQAHNPADSAAINEGQMAIRRRKIFATSVLAALLTTGCQSIATPLLMTGQPTVENNDTEILGRQLYAALAAGDAAALNRLLHPDFEGKLTAGLPNGLGRTYQGRDTMMTEGWGKVGKIFAMKPKIERLFVDGDTLIGLGTYEGEAIETRRPVSARFAHFWQVEDGTFRSVEQVTDSNGWRIASEE